MKLLPLIKNVFKFPYLVLPKRLSTEGSGTLKYTADKFEVNINVTDYKPEELSVNVSKDNIVTIEGKHEEKQDEQGLISRHFVRKYILKKKYDLSKIESKLFSDGVLVLSAPAGECKQLESKKINIVQTGKPADTW